MSDGEMIKPAASELLLFASFTEILFLLVRDAVTPESPR